MRKNASVREISDAMLKSKDTANDAVLRVAKADEQAKRLSSAAEAISGIVQIIGDITGQINLLALNATIEVGARGRSRSGICRRGIRGQESNQAKQASDKITKEIGSLNGISGDVVTALKSIRQAIQSVSEYVTSTAAAVEQQSTVTGEMSTSMQRAAAEAASIGQQAA